MMLILLPIIVVILVFFFIGTLQAGTPEGIAKEIAKTQLESFLAIKGKNPDMPPKQLYINTIMSRPGYNGEQAKNIVKDAEELAKEHNEKMGLRMAVFQLITVEYLARTTHPPHKYFDEFWGVVSSIIPDDI